MYSSRSRFTPVHRVKGISPASLIGQWHQLWLHILSRMKERKKSIDSNYAVLQSAGIWGQPAWLQVCLLAEIGPFTQETAVSTTLSVPRVWLKEREKPYMDWFQATILFVSSGIVCLGWGDGTLFLPCVLVISIKAVAVLPDYMVLQWHQWR